jgi:hypothetical protein
MGFQPSHEQLKKIDANIKANFAELGPFELREEQEYCSWPTPGYHHTGLVLVHFYEKDIILRTLWGDDFSIRRLGYFNIDQAKALAAAVLQIRKK